MARDSRTTNIDLQRLFTEAARLELKTLNAGVEYWQVWMNQTAKFSNIASDTLEAMQDDEASASDAAQRLTDFGKENAAVFADLSSRMSKDYFEELSRLIATVDDGGDAPERAAKPAPRPRGTTKPTTKRAPTKKVNTGTRSAK